MKKDLIGTGGLIRLILRRDRILLLLWMLVTLSIILGGAATIENVYPTVEARQERFDQVMNIPMFMLFQSKAFDISPGALVTQQAFGGTTILAALGSALFLVRHTRKEEQTGRRELIGSTVVGRHAPLAAALTVVLGAGVILAAVSNIGLIGIGFPMAGSLALGLVVGSAVWIAAAMAAVAAQLTENSGVASVSAIVLFYGFHFVRGISDMGGESLDWLGWLVPNGWLERVRPFAGERWWIFGLIAVFVILLLRLAFRLAGRRDLGAGLIPARNGPATAPAGLRNPIGLAWRLQRRMLFFWIGLITIIALPSGFVGPSAMKEYAQSQWLQEYAAAINVTNPTDAFFTYLVFVMVFPIAMYAIMATLRMRSDEAEGTAEMILTTSVNRGRWAASHLAFGIGAPVILLVILGFGFGLGNGVQSNDLSGDIARMLRLTTSLVPAVWVIVGITMAAFGLLGRVSNVIGWTALAVGIITEIIVKMKLLPEWLFLVLSPFAHVNPYFRPSAMTFAGLTLLSAVLVILGFYGLKRRDLTN
ncbi:ABC transporter permease [Geosporobacter ferrireducens]|uniref:ABC transporter permease n=1 Tax=Geosporobacter ferrireducens TaxID=1424294 RepID=UPI00139E2122|nr:hypothetical protein [Geosporobacter ferrireducens]MTI57396.1 antibiotic ABC transporter [Geosporobacter ferrireducens]